MKDLPDKRRADGLRISYLSSLQSLTIHGRRRSHTTIFVGADPLIIWIIQVLLSYMLSYLP